MPLRWWRSATGGASALLGWTTQNRLRAGLVAGACLLSAAVMVIGSIAIAKQRSAGPPVTLETVLEALDLRAYDDARDMAQRLKEQGTLPLAELGAPPFVLGAVAAYEGDDTWSKDKINYYLLAARHLEEARDRGFPAGRRAEGLYLLGRSLYFSGKIPASRRVLLEALKLYKHQATEIHRLLAGAYLHDADPMLQEALAENEIYLSDRKLPAAVRHEGLLQRAQILLLLDRIAECTAELGKIPANAKNHADAIIMQGRVLMHEASQLRSKPDATSEDQLKARRNYRAAIKTLQRAQGRDTLSTQATRKAMYLIGVCYLQLGDYRAALARFSRTYKQYPELAEGLAASFQEAELSRQLGRDGEALAGYRRTLSAITDPENFSNPWITLKQLRSRIRSTYEHYLQTQNFEIALQLTRLFYPLFSRVQTLELMAAAHRAWGQALLRQAADVPPDKADPLRQLGREQLRQAGRVYGRLAELETATRRYPDDLWYSASAYLAGQDYVHAIGVLQQYLKDQARRRHPQALVHLGEAMLALNRTDEALESFRECIEFHQRDAAAYRARLLASRAYLERGDLQQVETLLQENLNGEDLTPSSQEWRDSLFALGELLHIEHRYAEAIRRLEEAVERYPDDPQTLPSRYLIADSYRQAAATAQKKLEQDLPGTARVTHSRQIREQFETALQRYEEIREIISRRQETGELTSREKLMLRNCYFAVGDIYFDLGQYEAAIRAYRTTTNRYQSRPAVLLAYVQIASAYRRLNKPLEARATLEQAKAVLGRIKTESAFTETTNYNRQQWTELLDSLSNL